MAAETVDYAAIDSAVQRHKALAQRMSELQEMLDLLTNGETPFLTVSGATSLPLVIPTATARDALRDAITGAKQEETRLARRLDNISKAAL